MGGASVYASAAYNDVMLAVAKEKGMTCRSSILCGLQRDADLVADDTSLIEAMSNKDIPRDFQPGLMEGNDQRRAQGRASGLIFRPGCNGAHRSKSQRRIIK